MTKRARDGESDTSLPPSQKPKLSSNDSSVSAPPGSNTSEYSTAQQQQMIQGARMMVGAAAAAPGVVMGSNGAMTTSANVAPPPMMPQQHQQYAHQQQQQMSSSSLGGNGAPQISSKREVIVSDALAYLEQVRLQYADRPDVYVKFLDLMREYKMNVIDVSGVIQRIKQLFKENKPLILGFNTFLPPNQKITTESLEEKRQGTTSGTTSAAPESDQDEFDEAISFVTRIKERFKNQSEIYKKFLDCLHRYQMGTTTIASVYEEVTSLFKDQADLLDDFKKFLPKPVQEEAQKRIKSKQKEEKAQQQKVQKETELAATEQQQQQQQQASYVIGAHGVPTAIQRQMELASGKSFEELEDPVERLKHARPDSEKYGPSYRLPPKNYPQAVCSQRSDLCRQVLNDELVSVPAGSEESRDIGGRDAAAETLFQCEDDRCELDIVIEQNMSTLRLFGPLNDQIRNGQQVDFSMDDLKDINRAAIHRIYGEKWNDVMESLKQKPQFSIPIIYARLQQKAQEWENARKELNVFWRNLYKENTIRAENQETTRFKHLEKKRLNPTDVVQDIHDRHMYHTELVCLMSEKSIHRDIFMLLKKYAQFNAEQDAQFKKLWQRFVIPFLALEKKKAGAAKNNKENGDDSSSSKDNTLIEPIVEQPLRAHFCIHKFYANITFLLFMRYYDFMYERLRNAKNKSLYQQSVHQRRRAQKSASAIVEKYADEVLDTDQFSGYISGATLSKKKRQKQIEINANDFNQPAEDVDVNENYYQEILRHTGDLLSGNTEQDKYESTVRKYLGYQAYEMFTFGKLFKVLKNNILSLVKEEECEKLLQTFEYERRRINAFQDKVYYYNAYKLMAKEYVYCFTFNWQKRHLVVSMIDPPSSDLAKTEREREGLEYVQKYVHASVGEEPSETKDSDSTSESHRGIFLKRNLKKIKSDTPNKDVQLLNGLECKICIATFKMFYVQDTWDLMVRRVTSIPEEEIKKRKAAQHNSFVEWHGKRLEEIGGADNSEDVMQIEGAS
eukprot:CAMPEP_0117450034 /NCGR_PEP_ID=MMETSP0759-20121206/8256_1 /TAXON_ID=63605 /ORGANISM="Percolomonas cosmopolitus, Strain WS" /LENGTH=1012 /DNA_ID=CAMNT_0005242535 /DNA_START=38 /DNA_END=3076 /DNA_ORIENTATION=-